MDLGFKKIALNAFEFLESKYDFSCVESDSLHLRYESPKVFVQVSFDGNRSFELTCSVGRMDDFKGSNQVPFDLGEVLRSEGGTVENTGVQVTTSNALEKFSNLLAEKLEKFGHRILTGDDAAFTHAAELRSQASIEYAKEKQLEQMRRSLDQAWANKNHRRVVELLSSMEEWLSPSEVKKLEYSRKQMK